MFPNARARVSIWARASARKLYSRERSDVTALSLSLSGPAVDVFDVSSSPGPCVPVESSEGDIF